MHTCEHCALTYNLVAFWHCPSAVCVARRAMLPFSFNYHATSTSKYTDGTRIEFNPAWLK
jgi:hypothetical protein